MRGFTLIELIVVLMIATIAMSLVGPRIVRTYEKMQAQSEVKVFTEVLNEVRMSAFIARAPYAVEMGGHEVKVFPTRKLFRFKWLGFPENAKIQFNANGFPDRTQLKVLVGGQTYNVAFPLYQNLK